MASSCIPEGIGGSSQVVKESDNSEQNLKEPEKVEDDYEDEDSGSEEGSGDDGDEESESESDEDSESEEEEEGNEWDEVACNPVYRALNADRPSELLPLLKTAGCGLDNYQMPLMFMTPLQFACRYNKMNCVKALVRSGASLLHGQRGRIPLHDAVRSGDPLSAIQYLVEAAKARNDGTLSKMLTAVVKNGFSFGESALLRRRYPILKYLDSILSEEAPSPPNKRPKN